MEPDRHADAIGGTRIVWQDFFGSAQEAAAERYEPDLVALRRRVQDRFLSELGTLDTPQWQSGAGAT